MFNRGKEAEGPLCVEITLQGGQTLKGRFNVPQGRTLPEALNSPTPFVEFEPFGGERTFLAKSSLQLVRPMNAPPNPTLGAGVNANGFDPYAVLGVPADADKDEVRRAYLNLAKAYHPDRYATVDLPGEVRDYLAAMARRINAAHDAITAKLRDKPAPEEPVFTSPGR